MPERRRVRPAENQEIVVLITVIKKGSKIHARHMEVARKRMKEVHGS